MHTDWWIVGALFGLSAVLFAAAAWLGHLEDRVEDEVGS